MNHRKQLTIWLFSCLFIVFLIVIVGGSVRLTGSGLSIVYWKPVTGILPPLNDQEWSKEFHAYQQFPEYKKVNFDITLSDYKYIYWWEYIHRILGRLLGLVFLIPFLIFRWQKKINTILQKKMIIIFLLGGLQGFIGWFMVKSGLSDKPQVSHYRLALHLSLAYLIFCSMLWMMLGFYRPQIRPVEQRKKKSLRLNQWLLFFLGFQIIYGAFVAGLKAGYIYNTFPLMGSYFFPDSAFHLQPFWINFFDSKPMVQFIHRILGYLIFFLGIIFTFQMYKDFPKEKIIVHISLFLLVLQVILGVATLVFAVPTWLGVMHQGNSLLLLASYLICLYKQLYVDGADKDNFLATDTSIV